MSDARVDQLQRRRSPRVARWLSIIPGVGQLYYGARGRAAQYFAGVVVPAFLAALLYQWSLFDLATAPIGGLAKSLAFLVSELVVLALVVVMFSFWIAASWDARQGTLALNEGRDHRPKWWYVKVKEFLFDDPEEMGEETR
jgi:TM2 domain-containing membrane protein YozV